MLAEPRRRKPDRSRHARRHPRQRRCIPIAPAPPAPCARCRMARRRHRGARAIATRARATSRARDAVDDAMRAAPAVRRSSRARRVVRELVSSSAFGAGTPLRIVTDGDDHRSVRRVEELVRDEVRVRVSPSRAARVRLTSAFCATFTSAASALAASETWTRRPTPVRPRSTSAARIAIAASLPARTSASATPSFIGSPVRLAGDGHPAALGLDDEVVAGAVGLRAEPADRAPDQRGSSARDCSARPARAAPASRAGSCRRRRRRSRAGDSSSARSAASSRSAAMPSLFRLTLRK